MERKTILFKSPEKPEQQTTEEILSTVYDALEEKGYNAIDQMVGNNSLSAACLSFVIYAQVPWINMLRRL